MSSPFSPAGAHFSYLTPPGLNASDGDFSPDGTQIAFQGPGNTIYTVPAAGGSPALVLSEAAVPAWGPHSLPGAPAGPGAGTGYAVAHCKVPKLLGKTLGAARKAISHAGCRVGKITRRRSTRQHRGRVIAESPKAGKTLAGGAKINLALGR